MTNVNLSIEELTALKEANQPSVFEVVLYFTATLPHYNEDEFEIFKFTNQLIDKLKAMDEEQYNNLDFTYAIDLTDVEADTE